MKIAGVVLAAGQSLRFGGNKLLADLGGQALVRRTVHNLMSVGLDEIFVVTGHEAANVSLALAGTKVKFILNPAYAQGLSSSLKEGVAAAAKFDAVLVCLGDMPLVSAIDYRRIIRAFNATGIVVPTYDGQRGNPVLWGSRYFGELQALTGDQGARALLDKYRDAIIEVEVSGPGIFLDADTPEALAKIKSIANF